MRWWLTGISFSTHRSTFDVTTAGTRLCGISLLTGNVTPAKRESCAMTLRVNINHSSLVIQAPSCSSSCQARRDWQLINVITHHAPSGIEGRRITRFNRPSHYQTALTHYLPLPALAFLPRDAMLMRYTVRPPCPSVAIRYCNKMAQRRITKTTPYDSPKLSRFFFGEIPMGSTPNRDSK